jgi:hypothetical protein
MKVFISQAMAGLSNEEIEAKRNAAIEHMRNTHNDKEIEVLDSFFKDNTMTPIECFAQGLALMAQADIVLFVSEWSKSRGCMLEHQIASAYGLEIDYYK